MILHPQEVEALVLAHPQKTNLAIAKVGNDLHYIFTSSLFPKMDILIMPIRISLVHGQWGQWGSFDTCDKTCGTGMKKRTRSCNNPAPSGGGNDCMGSDSHTLDCNTNPCVGS